MNLLYCASKNPLMQSTSFTMAKVALKDGVNELSDGDFAKLKAHPDFGEFIELGVFKECEDGVVVLEEPKPKARRKPSQKTPLLLDPIE